MSHGLETGQSASEILSGLEWTSDKQYDYTSSQIVDPAWSSKSLVVPSVRPAGPSIYPDEPTSPLGSCPDMPLRTPIIILGRLFFHVCLLLLLWLLWTCRNPFTLSWYKLNNDLHGNQ
ncbi:hypothetical protein Tco_1569156 [Tanacetum coccineum]